MVPAYPCDAVEHMFRVPAAFEDFCVGRFLESKSVGLVQQSNSKLFGFPYRY